MKVLQTGLAILALIIAGVVALKVLGFVLKLVFGLVGLVTNLIALVFVVLVILFLVGLARRAFRT